MNTKRKAIASRMVTVLFPPVLFLAAPVSAPAQDAVSQPDGAATTNSKVPAKPATHHGKANEHDPSKDSQPSPG
ncbi:MAG TPA: hypothetical protein VGI60_05025 [Chthoniobacterales bacterium]